MTRSVLPTLQVTSLVAPAVLSVVAAMLVGLGYRPIPAGDAADGMARIADHPDVALLLSDLVLPGKTSGVELARRLRRENPGLRVLLMSGYTADIISPDEPLEIDVLGKPFTPEELGRAVRMA